MTRLISTLLVPPACILILLLLGLLMRRWRLGLSTSLILLATAILWISATPVLAIWQLRAVEVEAPKTPLTGTGARAMVVLGAGSYVNAPEYGNDTVSSPTLERVRYAARLYRLTGAPIMVTGGSPAGVHSSEDEQMRDVLIQEFTTPVTWLESSSVDTFESAVLCEKMLHEEGIKKVLLVTHSWHMRRARSAFERAGLEVVAAPMGFATLRSDLVAQWVPDAGAMVVTDRAWHEAIGLVWYRFRFWFR